MDYVYLDAFRGDVGIVFQGHGNFPSIEAKNEFDYSIKHALIGSYKSGFDYLRTCLEMTLLHVYFHIKSEKNKNKLSFDELIADVFKPYEDANSWLKGNSDTPFFSKMVKEIKTISRITDIDNKYDWIEKLKNNYYKLSDYTHVKGFYNGIQRMNNVNHYVNSSSYHNINKQTLCEYLDTLIETIENVLIIVTLYNPVVLVELPLEEKFGINEPMGFIQSGQVEIIQKSIPNLYKDFFEAIVKNDEEILGLVDWVNSRPDITEDEINKQFEELDSLISNSKKE